MWIARRVPAWGWKKLSVRSRDSEEQFRRTLFVATNTEALLRNELIPNQQILERFHHLHRYPNWRWLPLVDLQSNFDRSPTQNCRVCVIHQPPHPSMSRLASAD